MSKKPNIRYEEMNLKQLYEATKITEKMGRILFIGFVLFMVFTAMYLSQIPGLISLSFMCFFGFATIIYLIRFYFIKLIIFLRIEDDNGN